MALGSNTLLNNTIGSNNTASGAYAGYSNKSGNYNTVVGDYALYSNISAHNNTAVGHQSLYNNLGNANTAIGSEALKNNTIGINNTGIGFQAGLNLPANVNNTISIGSDVGWITTSSNQVNIGNLSQTSIGGQVNWSVYSDKRIKKNIQENVPGLQFIQKLKAVTYTLDIDKQYQILSKGSADTTTIFPEKYDIEKMTQTGFLAQDVAQAAEECGFNFSGVEIPKDENELYKLRYSDFVMPLVKSVQEQQTIIEKLNQEVLYLEKSVKDLQKK